MRLRQLRLPALVIAVVVLDAAVDAPRPAAAQAASSCSPGDCLANAAVNNRVQPTSVTADDKGDVTFFASQSGQLPNIVVVLDNSTSMYELPFDVATFPNSAWVNKGPTPTTLATGTPAGATPNACGNYTSGASCPTVTFSASAASCGGNSFFAGLKDVNGNAYNKSTTYSPPDPAFGTYFTNNNVYKFMEWNTTSPGGVANGAAITFTPGVGGSPVLNKGTVSAASGACNNANFSSTASGGTNNNAWTITQKQRCQMCLDEVGYYIAPVLSGTQDQASGNILFKGNWLNFYPPKFIVARKVLTDFISRQSLSTTAAPVRIGVVSYDPNNTSALNVPNVNTGFSGRADGGAFISAGMVPDCDQKTWATATVPKGTGPSQQDTLISAVRGISFGSGFTTNAIATPLAETLFNVGQFLSGSDTFYTSSFGSQWLKPGFTAPTGANRPLCVSCQVNGIVLITDGEPFGDNNLPTRFRNNTIQCPHTTGADPCGTDQNNGSANLLDDVTNFLATTDLSPDASGGLKGIQDAITFVIGMGLKVPLLDNAAKFGKTTSAMRADNAQDLESDVTSAVVSIVARATAFSSTAIQTLEVGTGSTAFVPRFVPGSPLNSIWEGHLFRFDLFNEFVAGVDKNGDGNKDGVFLIDKDGDIVTEDDKGAFHKLINGQPGAPAVPVWDAGAQLDAMAASSRNLYTGVWNSSTGKWSTIALPSWNGSGTPPSDFVSVENALGIVGTNACAQILKKMATPVPAAYLSSTGVFDNDHCAKAILDYVRGFNVLNELAGTNSVTVNRAHMLGDIFHSSPVVVDPPVDQFICNLGLHTQCVSTLYQYDTSQPVARLPSPTPSAQYTSGTKTLTAYEKFWEDHETRQRVVLVGANDGMIHAFDAGSPTSTPPTLNASVGFRQVVYNGGTGNELWAFVPPDQLPRLWLMLRDGHQIYMDGDIMVRDVWVDGAANDKGAAGYVNQPLVKQDVEYHTVAVAAERQGGTHFVGLDVTDTTTPKLLWVYPPPCSQDEAVFGQTWSQFSPKPPPIGPVLLQTNNAAGLPNYGADHTEERYAVFLNGGHGPYQTRGRAAAIVDVYTGSPLFVARYSPVSTIVNDPAKAMRFGFAATGALADYGNADDYVADGIFDTGVIGDEGGQLWTLRMAQPGHVNSSTGLVDNWTFGRAYEPSSASSNDPRVHQPIYTITSVAVDNDNWLRAYVGTGDRAHVRSQNGGDCRPDDPMSCITAGCNVTSSLTMDNGPVTYASTFGSAAGNSSTSPAIISPTQTLTSTANACNRAAVSQTMTVNCSATPSMSFTENTLNFTCAGSPLACTEGGFPQPTPDTGTASPAGATNQFLAVAVLASLSPARRMNGPTATSADDGPTYDSNRITSSMLTDVSNVTAGAAKNITSAAQPATPGGPGWILKFPTIDEKTVTSATVLGGCVLWNTLLPSGGTVGCASAGANTANVYQADEYSGAPNCASAFISGNTYQRKITRAVLSPPPEPAAAVAIGAGGSSMRLSTLEIQPGSQEVTQTTVATSNELFQMVYSLPLSVDQHMCRHVDPTACK